MSAIVAGWGIAQEPQILPGLTVDQAAADDATLVALLVSLAIGAVILIPSLLLLFGLVLRGRFAERPEALGSLEKAARQPVATGPRASFPRRPAAVVAFACAAIGVPLTVANDAGAGSCPAPRFRGGRRRLRRAPGSAQRERRRPISVKRTTPSPTSEASSEPE